VSAPTRILDRIRAAAPTISVGILSADLMALGTDLARLQKAGVVLLHFDVMDGCFCPMLTVGAPFVKAIRTDMLKDVHLMVDQPLDKLPAFVAAGADILTIHFEASGHPQRLLQAMENLARVETGLVRGIALNPSTPIPAIEALLNEVDMITLLAVNPGVSGQTFLKSTEQRMEQLIQLVRTCGRDILTVIDGGVTKTNIADISRLGADIIVTGSAVFDGQSVEDNLRHILRAVAKRPTAENGEPA
jgi:ribulose-phosphate 3-epimerase